jgi:hypothetical protein
MARYKDSFTFTSYLSEQIPNVVFTSEGVLKRSVSLQEVHTCCGTQTKSKFTLLLTFEIILPIGSQPNHAILTLQWAHCTTPDRRRGKRRFWWDEK